MGKPKFVIKKRINGEFMFNLKAGNGETIATSEGYSSKQGCKDGIESVRNNAPIAEIEDQS
ncbi:YegP family protein [Mesoflavibacter zeaxanthinifaciens]|uniref:YegP family protein n=1 Tax=Mesoflavibacter zeaxanthinifaciens TaxID=393060 RepID=UPI003A8F1CE0